MSDQAYESVRARNRLVWQGLAHVVFIVAGVLITVWKLPSGRLFPGILVGAALAVVIGAFLAWILPWLAREKKSAPYVFVSPFFILFFTFGVFPILFSLYLSFQTWDPATGLGAIQFGGWYRTEAAPWLPLPANYYYAVTDRLFLQSAWNTAVIAVVSGVPQHLVGMPLAYFFHTAYKRWRNFVTGAYFLPFITSSIAIAFIFRSLFSTHFGVINATIDSLAQIPGLAWLPHGTDGHINWLGKEQFVKPAISLVVFWRYLGWNTVLYLSALQAISNDLFEAAEMDGATRWQTFSKIVVPLLRPMMLFAITLTIIGNLQLFEEPFVITGNENGNPLNSGMTSAMFMYKYMNEGQEESYGTACAISWMLFIVIALLTWVNQKLLSPRRGQEGVA